MQGLRLTPALPEISQGGSTGARRRPMSKLRQAGGGQPTSPSRQCGIECGMHTSSRYPPAARLQTTRTISTGHCSKSPRPRKRPPKIEIRASRDSPHENGRNRAKGERIDFRDLRSAHELGEKKPQELPLLREANLAYRRISTGDINGA